MSRPIARFRSWLAARRLRSADRAVVAIVAESAKLRRTLDKRRKGLDATANRLKSVCDTMLEDVDGRIKAVWADVERELSLARDELEEAGLLQKRMEETLNAARERESLLQDTLVPLLVSQLKLVQADVNALTAEATRRRVLMLPDRGPE